ncbi:MAG: ABC transporter ATP-binding protein [candidate division KSB1 bacterium]|nr:ABC transporter ATP-binding protein [candidate division KSB1 bacterium]MDZ7303249.1 ABC transporter ATP-binding protein [candidate division KSB1 bacterium]MDZ7312139.1 ABC transporter ATP-binding protein [candidate division KSB1 bacterium]
MLKVTNLETGYGNKQIINGISLEVDKGEIVAVIGHNGAGKSTLLKAIFGLLPVWKGSVQYNGKAIQNRRPTANIKDGLSFLLQGNRVFTELTVQENLEIGGYLLSDKNQLKARIEEVFRFFPKLRDRRQQNAGTLSGGEQQMLALSNALMLQPQLLMMDEPSLGLAPQNLRAMFEMIRQIKQALGTTFLIVEQKVRQVLAIADRAYILKLGQVSDSGRAEEFLGGERLRQAFL